MEESDLSLNTDAQYVLNFKFWVLAMGIVIGFRRKRL